MIIQGDITSPETVDYNCIAWAAKDVVRFWWPTGFPPYFWPEGIEKEETLKAFINAYATCGFQLCDHERKEDGWEKIAVYIGDDGKPKHAARQIHDTLWTSKLGQSFDITHPFVTQWSDLWLLGQKIDLSIYGHLGQLLKRKL